MQQIKKMQGVFSWVVIFSEISHVFCCFIPTIFSILTLLVGIGMIGGLPLWMDGLHTVMHDWEIPLIIFSGVVVALGWGLHIIARRLECHATPCAHSGCASKKDRSITILRFASVLFLVNVAIYTVVHIDGLGIMPAHQESTSTAHKHHHHDHAH